MSLLRTAFMRFARSPVSAPARKVVRRMRESLYSTAALHRMESKVAPVPVTVSASEPRRVNLLIPEINFNSFYGGYMAKFHLALRLARRGLKVRVVIVDLCEVDESRWREMFQNYAGLEDVFDHIEVSYQFDRSRPIGMNPDDAVIATTWWTAHIAGNMVEALRCDEFLYMIQEYEPFTFAMGSWYALADESYRLPHRAIFSSGLLRDYFARERIGVFSGSFEGIDGDTDSLAFENAIVSFSADEISSRPARAGRRLRLLFYARPEAHAHRNMFETGWLALNQAVEQGAFPADRWELHGIGTGHGDMKLAGGQTLKMIGKVSLDEYRRTLLQYDLGLSLMFTPHPSLLPLEMAGAGMEVVTTECMNKTDDAMRAISENIHAARPTMHAVARVLMDQARNIESRDDVQLPPVVNWSSSWDTTFDDRTLARIESWINK